MIPCWSLYIYKPYHGWYLHTVLDCTDYPTRKSAQRYVEDASAEIKKVNELDYYPRVAVVDDLREED